jgi:hypothetical protein
MTADPKALSTDLGAFAEAAGTPLARWQVESLALDAPVTAIVGPRQSGKSRSLAVLALWWAYRQNKQRVLVVSAGEDAARRLLAEARRIALGSELLAGSVVDEQAGLLQLTNGSEIRSVPASEKQIRGWAVNLLLCDEAALISDELLLGAAFPTTAAREGARTVLASSASVAAGCFYDHVRLGERGSENVKTFRWGLADCQWISPSAVEAARESMTEARFAAEYEGKFASGEDSLFTLAAIERASAPYAPIPLAELQGPARVLAGCDWGVTNNRSALVALARVPDPERRTFAVVCVERWAADPDGSSGVTGSAITVAIDPSQGTVIPPPPPLEYIIDNPGGAAADPNTPGDTGSADVTFTAPHRHHHHH